MQPYGPAVLRLVGAVCVAHGARQLSGPWGGARRARLRAGNA